MYMKQVKNSELIPGKYYTGIEGQNNDVFQFICHQVESNRYFSSFRLILTRNSSHYYFRDLDGSIPFPYNPDNTCWVEVPKIKFGR